MSSSLSPSSSKPRRPPSPSDPTQTNSSSTTSKTAPDTAELAQFRQKWKEELRGRERAGDKTRGRTGDMRKDARNIGVGATEEVRDGKRPIGGVQGRGLRESMSLSPPRQTGVTKLPPNRMAVSILGSSIGQTVSLSPVQTVPVPAIPGTNLITPLIHAPAASREPSIPTPNSTQQQPQQLSVRQKSALELYKEAVLEEQKGNQPDATGLYRRAFRLDANVDKLYHREEKARERALLSQLGNLGSSSTQEVDSPLSLARHLGHLKLGSQESPDSYLHLRSSQTIYNDRESYQFQPFNLSELIASWGEPVPDFLPSDDRFPIPLNKIPNELIIYILGMFVWNLDTASIEQFALVCRKMRVLATDGSIWRKFLELNLVPSQLSDPGISIDELCLRQYKSDYRRMSIEHPRVRFDGVYIAICHYVRNGLGDNPWASITHLITYRRFLRFFPNGKVLSYQANEDQDISEVVHSLQSGFVKKDLRMGSWHLLGGWLCISNLTEAVPSRFRGTEKYNFQMRLSLKSRPCLGKWNKLDMLGYESVDIETGDVSPFALRHERPYWFSKVRSYTI